MVRRFVWVACIALLWAAPASNLWAQTGGPDASGKSFFPTSYDFVPISGIGTDLNLAGDEVSAVGLPWSFSWYGHSYSAMKVSANGALVFDVLLDVGRGNTCLPASTIGAPDVAAYWDDLAPDLGGGVYTWHDTVEDRLIVSWEDVPHANSPGGASFQVHLLPNGEVEIHYADVDLGLGAYDHAASATVGVQDASHGTAAAGNWLEVSCNSASEVSDGLALVFSDCVDADGDGARDAGCGGEDCDDADAALGPDQPDVCNGLDDDCDPATSELVDGDGDGLTACEGDCDDLDPGRYPGAIELCNGLDDDCNGLADAADEDTDADADGAPSCADCDDDDPDRHPAAPEICNGLDDDCDAVVPADEVDDTDGDGWVLCADCGPADPAVHPSAFESCDGQDADCNGSGPVVDLPPSISSFSTGNDRGRGHIVYVDQTVTLDHIGFQLEGTPGDTITWFVYEATAAEGPFDQVVLVETTVPLSGGELDSGRLSVTLEAGHYYLLGAYHYAIATYGYNFFSSTPAQLSFGQRVGSARLSNLPTTLNINLSWSSYEFTLYTQNEADLDGDGAFPCGGDCDDTEAAVFEGAPELCDGLDNDCDGVVPGTEVDGDGDGAMICGGDCDDGDADTSPDAAELCDALDNDCDGSLGPAEQDLDQDGYFACAECDDDDALVFPGAAELCNGLDDDCDGSAGLALQLDSASATANDGNRLRGHTWLMDRTVELGSMAFEATAPPGTDLTFVIYESEDAAGPFLLLDSASVTTEQVGLAWHESPALGVSLQAGRHYLLGAFWVDDLEYGWRPAAGLPMATEYGTLLSGVAEDFLFFPPAEAAASASVATYPLRHVFLDEVDEDGDGSLLCGDCDDFDGLNSPDFTEACDGQDNDCNGLIDADVFDEVDADGDGVRGCDDCDDGDPQVSPELPEACDGIDTDCDEDSNEHDDLDGDGFSLCDGDCDDVDPLRAPGLPELCDGVDNDCDEATDELVDADGDGLSPCEGDCDDDDPNTLLGGQEFCNGADDDCDGLVPVEELDEDGDGVPACGGDCDDTDAAVNPHAAELCADDIDNDCDDAIDSDDPDCFADDDDSAPADDDDSAPADDDDSAPTDDDDSSPADDDDSGDDDDAADDDDSEDAPPEEAVLGQAGCQSECEGAGARFGMRPQLPLPLAFSCLFLLVRRRPRF